MKKHSYWLWNTDPLFFKLSVEEFKKQQRRTLHLPQIITHQPAYSWPQILWIVLKHPSNLYIHKAIIGPDTGLFNWQIARKLKRWEWADRIKDELAEKGLKPAFCGDHYEVHKEKNV